MKKQRRWQDARVLEATLGQLGPIAAPPGGQHRPTHPGHPHDRDQYTSILRGWFSGQSSSSDQLYGISGISKHNSSFVDWSEIFLLQKTLTKAPTVPELVQAFFHGLKKK